MKSVWRPSVLILAQSLGIFLIAASGTRAVLAIRTAVSGRKTAGFDFAPLRDAKLTWSGPKIGSRIDLSQLKSRDQVSLASEQNRLILLALADPRCGLSAHSAKYYDQVRTAAENQAVRYVLASFAYGLSDHKFFGFTASLAPNVKSFLWNWNSPPPDALARMVTPAHVLVRGDGTVVQTWPGGGASSIEQEMAHQIAEDMRELIRSGWRD